LERKVRCGVIGTGWWATFAHVPALLSHPGAELLALQKRDSAEAARVARDFGVPHAFTSAEELIALPGLEAVVVASSPNKHFEHAATALRRGLHVLVEKPMTLTVAQARELVRLAEAGNRQLIVSCPWHYTRHGQEARELILSGALGGIRMISVLMTNPVQHLIRGTGTEPTHGKPYLDPRHLDPRPGTYSDPAVAGGGQIYTQVSHPAAYLTFLTNARAARVFARFHNDGSAMDIYNTLAVELETGAIVTLASTGATPLERRDYEVRVFGTEGILLLELWRGTMTRASLKGGAEVTYPDLPAAEIYPERAPAGNLIDAILGFAPNLSPGTLGLAAMEVIEAACQSARSGESIAIREVMAEQ
jgi:predicted dehydrogenase